VVGIHVLHDGVIDKDGVSNLAQPDLYDSYVNMSKQLLSPHSFTNSFMIVTLVDRGYISDEDTSIYNPGLTLLTESEKERLTSAIIASKKAAVNENQWSENNKFAFEFLRDKLDPFHTYELGGYLAVLPSLALVVYLGVLAVQQTARNLYPAAYFGGIAILVLPAIVLIVLGPQ
jgi:hypothetical protein